MLFSSRPILFTFIVTIIFVSSVFSEGEISDCIKANEIISNKFSCLFSNLQTNEHASSTKIIPWKTMKENIDYFWSSESKQRYNGQISLNQAIKALDSFEALKVKIHDSSDPLLDISRYRDLLSISGFSGKLYWMVEDLYWKGEFSRAKEGFEFFLFPENKDLFTVGASHFYLGRMALDIPFEQCWYPDDETKNSSALYHLLSVHNYPTCLTYISYSYIYAARLYNEMNYPLPALALIMVDVPSIDWKSMKYNRHFNGADYCYYSRDITNYVKNVIECIRYCDKGKDYVKNRIRKMHYSEELWNYCATNHFTRYDLSRVIDKIMHLGNKIPQEEMLLSAVTHQWPDNASIPEAIATNRVLNNNIFSK